MNILREIKWAYQRVRYGYDDTIKWSFSGYFRQFIKPLKEFCEQELKDILICSENFERIVIYPEILRLIKNFEERTETYLDNTESELWKFVGANLLIFWN